MNLISKLVPLNAEVEKQRFRVDRSYNPQFVFTEQVPATVLEHWGKPKTELVEYAKELVFKKDRVVLNRVPYENHVIEQLCRELLTTIGVVEPITINFIPGKVARCGVHKTIVDFQDRPKFDSPENLQATLNHEIQTHLLRNLNQQKQGWVLTVEGAQNVLRTEEGLAVLHGRLAQPAAQFWRPAAYYLAVDLSLRYSFAEVFQQLLQFGIDREFAWRLCLRTKRGISDTSVPGAMTKDVCYLEGVLKVWDWISRKNHNPLDLYLGKISIEEVETRKLLVSSNTIYVPLFMKNMDEYLTKLKEIGESAGFQSVY
jgi:hypothetical protein